MYGVFKNIFASCLIMKQAVSAILAAHEINPLGQSFVKLFWIKKTRAHTFLFLYRSLSTFLYPLFLKVRTKTFTGRSIFVHGIYKKKGIVTIRYTEKQKVQLARRFPTLPCCTGSRCSTYVSILKMLKSKGAAPESFVGCKIFSNTN